MFRRRVSMTGSLEFPVTLEKSKPVSEVLENPAVSLLDLERGTSLSPPPGFSIT